MLQPVFQSPVEEEVCEGEQDFWLQVEFLDAIQVLLWPAEDFCNLPETSLL